MLKAFEIVEILKQYGKAYIVGGSVRDFLLKNDSHDIDIATNVPMETIEDLFQTYDIGKNKDFGVVVIKYKDETFEIAQFRKDGVYSDGRHPSNVSFISSFKEDCARRDFTINAMGLDHNKNIIDYNHGLDDLKDRIIRTVGDPDKRFSEDYLRMLRAVRFAARFNFTIEHKTKKSIIKNSKNIISVSKERITQEIWKMASQDGESFSNAISLLDQTSLIKYVLPEIENMKGYLHNLNFHPEGHVFEHVLAAIRINKEKNPILNLAILFHDVGKPKTYVYKDGKHTYYNHDYVGSKMIKEIFARMKFDNRTTEIVSFCALHHMKLHLFDKMKSSKVINLISNKYWDYLKDVGYADSYSRGKFFGDKDWPIVENRIKQLNSVNTNPEKYSELKKLINGNLVMNIRNIPPSKDVGIIIKKTIDWIIDKNVDINTRIDDIKKYILHYNI